MQTVGTGTASKGVLPSYPGNFGCFASLTSLISQYKPQFYVNGHDHQQTVAVNSVNPADSTLYITSGAGAQISQADGVSPNNNNPGTNLPFSNVQLDAQGNVSTASGGFTLFTATAAQLKMEVIVPLNGWRYPMACSYDFYAGHTQANAGSMGTLTSKVFGAQYVSASGISNAIGYQVTGPFAAGCISCVNASLDRSGMYSAVCNSPAYPNAVSSNFTLTRGFMVPYTNANTTYVSPMTSGAAYTCTVPPGLGKMSTCTCGTPGVFTACRPVTPPSPPPMPPMPPMPPPKPPLFSGSISTSAYSSFRLIVSTTVLLLVSAGVAAMN